MCTTNYLHLGMKKATNFKWLTPTGNLVSNCNRQCNPNRSLNSSPLVIVEVVEKSYTYLVIVLGILSSISSLLLLRLRERKSIKQLQAKIYTKKMLQLIQDIRARVLRIRVIRFVQSISFARTVGKGTKKDLIVIMLLLSFLYLYVPQCFLRS